MNEDSENRTGFLRNHRFVCLFVAGAVAFFCGYFLYDPLMLRPAVVRERTVVLPGNVPLSLMLVPAGRFKMGSLAEDRYRFSDERLHSVAISRDFWLGKTEVTQLQYKALMGENPSRTAGDDFPVENVSWLDAMAFCQRLTEQEKQAGRLPSGYEYTLPTEAQWEYACRGGDRDEGYAYSGSNNPGYVIQGLNIPNRHHFPVGGLMSNRLGLHDMCGNVSEWCLDWYGDYVDDAVDPRGPLTGSSRVSRGGGYVQPLRYFRAADRRCYPPNTCLEYQGFRVALAPVGSASADAP